jgi:tetratricopeptide (TPR) repeat protein
MQRFIPLFLVLVCACAHRQIDGTKHLFGPATTTVPLLRSPGGGDKIFVEVKLSDGQPRLFLVDTGAALSVVSQRVAIELNLDVQHKRGQLAGINGRTNWIGARLSSLRIGRFTLKDLRVAVAVTGIPSHVGMVPLDGIIGSDLLSHFQLEIDYPNQSLTLSLADHNPTPAHAVPLFLQGHHPMTQATLTARNGSGETVEQPVLLEVDTGARGILLVGGTLGKLGQVSTVGQEPVIGVGTPPVGSNDEQTRRFSVVRLPVGGVVLNHTQTGRWIRFDEPPSRHDTRLKGLLGYEAMKDHKLLLDYPAKRFALSPSEGDKPKVDVHEWFIRRGEASKDPLMRVRALYIIGKTDEARRRLGKLAKRSSEYPEAVALLSRIERREGNTAMAAERLATLSVRDLIDTGEIINSVNGLWLEGHTKEALKQAKFATILSPRASQGWIAYADVLLASGDPSASRIAVAEAIAIEGNPDAYLLRRAIISRMEKDFDGALTHLRRLVRNKPTEGFAHWLLAKTAVGKDRKTMAQVELSAIENRLHPEDIPLDFLAGAWHMLHDETRAQTFMEAGLARDCGRARDPASELNCQAWYQALAGIDLDQAQKKVEKALAVYPQRAEFMDTLALVLEARGDIKGARAASWGAAAQAPDDVYLFGQALRIDALLPPK